MRRITGWLVVGHGPTNRASATVEEDETGTETDEERAAKKLDDLATAFERNRTAKRRHSEIHQGKTLWTEALRTGEVQIGNDRLPNGVTKAIKSPIDSSTCRQLEAALRERMLVIVRTARRDDAKNAAQLLASMTRGDRVRENALFDAISAREPTHGAQSDFDQGAIALNALHASITEHGVDENACERASTAIRQVGMGPVSSKSARDSLMWCLRRLIEQDSANTRPGAGLVLQGLEAGLAELVKRTGDRMLVGEHARTMRIYALRHLARRDPEQAVEYWMSTIEQLMLVTGPGREAVKYATLSREPVTFEALRGDAEARVTDYIRNEYVQHNRSWFVTYDDYGTIERSSLGHANSGRTGNTTALSHCYERSCGRTHARSTQ